MDTGPLGVSCGVGTRAVCPFGPVGFEPGASKDLASPSESYRLDRIGIKGSLGVESKLLGSLSCAPF